MKKERINISNLGREFLHFTLGISIIILFYFNKINKYSITIITILSIVISLLYKKYKFPILSFLIENFDKKDKDTFPGKGFIFFLLGSLFSIILFQKKIAIASIAVLTIGDPLSYIVGKYFGKIKIPWNNKKNIEGPLVGACLSTIFIYFLQSAGFVHINKYFLAFSASLISILIDLRIGDWEIDDNLTIPLIAGLMFTFISTL